MMQSRTKTTPKIPKLQPIQQKPWDFVKLNFLPSLTNHLSHQTLLSLPLALQKLGHSKIIYHQNQERCPWVWHLYCSKFGYYTSACMCLFLRSSEISTLTGSRLIRLLIATFRQVRAQCLGRISLRFSSIFISFG